MISVIGANSSLADDIEDIVWRDDVPYIDAVISYCIEKKIEVELVAGMIKKDHVLTSKIEAEAEVLRLLPKTSKLPI